MGWSGRLGQSMVPGNRQSEANEQTVSKMGTVSLLREMNNPVVCNTSLSGGKVCHLLEQDKIPFFEHLQPEAADTEA